MLTAKLMTVYPYSLTYKEERTAVINATSLSETTVSFGKPNSVREVFVFVVFNTAATRTVSSATIGGVSATISSQYSATTSGIACLFATVPTGDTGTVSVTFSGAVVSYSISVYEVQNRPNRGTSHTAVTQGASTNYAGGFTSGSLETPANGFSIGLAGISTNTAGAVTVNNNFVINVSTVGASGTYTAFGSSRNKISLASETSTITLTWTGTKSARWVWWSFN